MAVVGEIGFHKLLGIVDDTHGGDGVKSQVGPDQQGLGIRIGDAADAAAAVEVRQVPLELGAEGGVLNVVDLPLEAAGLVVDGHAAPAGAQMRVVVHTEENIKHAISLGDRSKKPAHYAKNSLERVMGSMY